MMFSAADLNQALKDVACQFAVVSEEWDKAELCFYLSRKSRPS